MPSFEERFYRNNPTRTETVRRDLALLRLLTAALWQWLVTGWRWRRAVARARARGETIPLEDLPA